MTSAELLKRNALRQIPNLKDLSLKFQDSRAEFLKAMDKAGAQAGPSLAEGVLESAAPTPTPAVPEETRGRRKEVLEAGGRALTKLAAKGEAAELMPDERFGLEAIIVLQGRPALLIRNGRFADPPDAWSKLARPDVRPKVKRLQPGKVLTGGTKEFEHDCSTLGGNSGSCVVDLETHQVIGLHFRGKYLEANTAVVLSRLKTDPLIKKAKLAFA